MTNIFFSNFLQLWEPVIYQEKTNCLFTLLWYTPSIPRKMIEEQKKICLVKIVVYISPQMPSKQTQLLDCLSMLYIIGFILQLSATDRKLATLHSIEFWFHMVFGSSTLAGCDPPYCTVTFYLVQICTWFVSLFATPS